MCLDLFQDLRQLSRTSAPTQIVDENFAKSTGAQDFT